jgi:hypothetical protein
VARVVVTLTLVVPLASCTSTQLDGKSPAYLIINSLGASPGAQPDEFGGVLASDVVTLVKVGQDADMNDLFAPTIFEDLGQVSFRLALKDPGSSSSPNVPTSANAITVTRYRVDYVRSDGRNTPGVDVPYGFDGAMTVTVGAEGANATMSIVRLQAKLEAPLKALAGGGGAIVISTLANVTFYGRDQAGREVSVSGSIGVNFSDWGDPS